MYHVSGPDICRREEKHIDYGWEREQSWGRRTLGYASSKEIKELQEMYLVRFDAKFFIARAETL